LKSLSCGNHRWYQRSRDYLQISSEGYGRLPVTGQNTLVVISTYSGLSSVAICAWSFLVHSSNLYFQQNTSPYIIHNTGNILAHYDSRGLKFLRTTRCSSIGEPLTINHLSSKILQSKVPLFCALIVRYDYLIEYNNKCTITIKLSPPPFQQSKDSKPHLLSVPLPGTDRNPHTQPSRTLMRRWFRIIRLLELRRT
jgi:hypothetical protein